MLSGRPTVAQNEVQIAHAPDALSPHLLRLPTRRGSRCDIETMQAAPELAEKDEMKKDDQTSNNPLV